ncbi:MAG: hypothetical protein KM310_05725 [Clostridiales bacterium]|nr:hypothetical protein [Clostridiales bacterium]
MTDKTIKLRIPTAKGLNAVEDLLGGTPQAALQPGRHQRQIPDAGQILTDALFKKLIVFLGPDGGHHSGLLGHE